MDNNIIFEILSWTELVSGTVCAAPSHARLHTTQKSIAISS